MRAAWITIVAGIAACGPSTATSTGALAGDPDAPLVEEPAADAEPAPLPDADELPFPDAAPTPDAPPPAPPSWNNPTCPAGQLPTGFGSIQCMQCMYMGGDSSEKHAAQLCLAAAQNCVGHIGGDATTMALACCERIGREHAVVWGIYWVVGLCQTYVKYPDL
jgi:hypothetical protein